MNIEYVKKDGEALIIDETNNDKTIKYYDNLDKVLVKENLIETMEEKVTKLKEEIKNYSELLKASKKERLYILLMFIFSTPILFTILNCFNLETVGTLLNAIRNGLIVGLFFIPGMTAFGLLLNSISLYQDNKLKKECSAKLAQVKFLSKEIIKNKEDIEELKKDLTNTDNSTEIKRVKVDDKELLKVLRDKIRFYYNIGYKQKKYGKYYKIGKLEKFVDKEELETVKEILEEKAPILVKKQK